MAKQSPLPLPVLFVISFSAKKITMRNCITLLICLSLLQNSKAQLNDAKYFNSMQWRMIGPHRGGRTVGAVGVPSQPNVFYIGVNNGGVWKTNDFGRTWKPIFDGQPTGSVGDVVVAPSNPDVIYVGSGEGVQRPYHTPLHTVEIFCIVKLGLAIL